MKAITLYQPWASLLACGAKQYETRSWATSYRGPIAIHAGVKPFQRLIKEIFPLHEWSYSPDYTMKRKFVDLISKFVDIDELQYGKIIATAELVGCHEIQESPILGTGYFTIGSFCEITGNELLFGDWTHDRYAWEFRNMKMLDEPIPARGRQRIWNWEGEV